MLCMETSLSVETSCNRTGTNCNLQIERVEQLGDSRFSGVVALDKGDTPNNWGWVRPQALICLHCLLLSQGAARPAR